MTRFVLCSAFVCAMFFSLYAQGDRLYRDTIVLKTGLKSVVDIDFVTEYHIVFYVEDSPGEKRVPLYSVERFERVTEKAGRERRFNDALLYFQSDNISRYYRTAEVIMPGEDKSVLYRRARNWFEANFRRLDWAVMVDDEVAGVIRGRGLFSQMDAGLDELAFELRVEISDGSFTYTFDELRVYVPKTLGNESLYAAIRKKDGEIRSNASTREGFAECYALLSELEASLLDAMGADDPTGE